MIWYVDHGGNRWRLCKIVGRALSLVTAETYDGDTVTGIVHRVGKSEIIEAK